MSITFNIHTIIFSSIFAVFFIMNLSGIINIPFLVTLLGVFLILYITLIIQKDGNYYQLYSCEYDGPCCFTHNGFYVIEIDKMFAGCQNEFKVKIRNNYNIIRDEAFE